MHYEHENQSLLSGNQVETPEIYLFREDRKDQEVYWLSCIVLVLILIVVHSSFTNK